MVGLKSHKVQSKEVKHCLEVKHCIMIRNNKSWLEGLKQDTQYLGFITNEEDLLLWRDTNHGYYK